MLTGAHKPGILLLTIRRTTTPTLIPPSHSPGTTLAGSLALARRLMNVQAGMGSTMGTRLVEEEAVP